MANILIVEDYQSLQKIYEETFRGQKHAVRLADNGKKGLRLAQKEHFDIILLDLLMPQFDGFEFLRTYDVKKHPDTQVIIISNIYTTKLLNKALELGASNYLLKSEVTPLRLAEIVQQTLDQQKNTNL